MPGGAAGHETQLRRPRCLSYRRGVAYRYWPLFDLRLRTRDLTLRPMAEADLAVIADLLPEDVEMDAAEHAYEPGDMRLSRGIQSHQSYWRAYGTWRPQAWRLGFVVRAPRPVRSSGSRSSRATTSSPCAPSTAPPS